MKSKTSARRGVGVTKGSNRNGNGNGSAAAHAEPARHAQGDELQGQPSILSLLAPPQKHDGALNKATLLAALIAFKKGDFGVRLPMDLEGMDGKIADAFNEVIELN